MNLQNFITPSNPRRMRAAATAIGLIGFFAFLWADAVFAADDPVATARKLLDQKKPAEAYVLLEPLERTRAGEPDFDYWLGVAAIESGKTERATIAFERVLIIAPSSAGARFELARAYYIMGTYELSKLEFERLLAQNPTSEGKKAIETFLTEIEKRKAKSRSTLAAYIDLSAGRDNNISSTTDNFAQGVQSAFGIPNILPTGNSIKRSANYGALQASVDFRYALTDNLAGVFNLDANGRFYQRESDFNIKNADTLAGMLYRLGESSIQGSVRAGQFRQQSATPVDLSGFKSTNNRNSTGGVLEIRHSFGSGHYLIGSAMFNRLRYTENRVQDTNQNVASLGYLREWQSGSVSVVSLYGGRDKALRPLNSASQDIDVTRKNAGVRLYHQILVTSDVNMSLLLGYSERKDSKAFARAALIDFGHDKTAEASLGAAWRFAQRWSLRPQVSYIRNQSNIALYEFSKTDINIAIRREFD